MNLNNPVWEIMTSELTTVNSDTPWEELKPLFNGQSIHHLPVKDASGKLLGIISTEDLSRAVDFIRPKDQLLARHLMTVSVQTVRTDTPVKEVINHFLLNRFRAIPVVDEDDLLVGIVTPYDIMALFKNSLEMEEI